MEMHAQFSFILFDYYFLFILLFLVQVCSGRRQNEALKTCGGTSCNDLGFREMLTPPCLTVVRYNYIVYLCTCVGIW